MTVDQIVSAILGLSEEERGDLALRLVQMDELMEDIEDVLTILRTADEPSRPYEEFIDELRAEGRDI